MQTKGKTDEILEFINQVKAVENGQSTIQELVGDVDKDWIDRALNNVTQKIVTALEQATNSNDKTFSEVLADAKNVPLLSLPIEKERHPYTSALLLFQCKQGSLAPNQEKSPYADIFPGTVPDDAQIVNDEQVKVNFDYADLAYLRMLVAPGNWQSTGLYAPAGTNITIEVPESVEHLDVQIGGHTDELGHLPTWDRAPIITFRESLKPGTNQVSSPFGGLIYFIPTKSATEKSETVTISGAVRAPYFIVGETDVNEWNETIKKYPAPWAELQGNNVIHTVPTDVIQHLELPGQLMDDWDDFVDQYNNLVGLGDNLPIPHTVPDRQHRYTSDIQISAGYMHAGYPMMIPITPAASQTVDFARIKDLHDGWGFWHEMGHEYQQVAWFWEDIVEVSVNIYSLYIQDYFQNPSRLLTKDENGDTYYTHAFEFLNREDPDKNFNQIGLFERLVMIRQLQMAYGWEFFTNLHVAYRELPEGDLPTADNEQEKIDTFVVMCSKVSGENLLEFFRLWGMPYSEDATDKVVELNLPDPKIPLWTIQEDGVGPDR